MADNGDELASPTMSAANESSPDRPLARSRYSHLSAQSPFRQPTFTYGRSPLSSLPPSSPPGSPEGTNVNASLDNELDEENNSEPNAQEDGSDVKNSGLNKLDEHIQTVFHASESSDTDFPQTSPIRGETKKERYGHRRRKQAKYRQREAEAQAEQDSIEEWRRLQAVYNSVLQKLEDAEATFGGLLLYVSDPSKHQGNARYNGFLQIRGRVSTILDYWTSSAQRSKAARDEVSSWAVKHVTKLVYQEGHQATADGFLRTRNRDIGPGFATNFTMQSQYEKLLTLCPTMLAVTEKFITSNRQRRTMSAPHREQKKTFVASCMLTCLGERSQQNNLAKTVIGLFAYAEGAHRQVISVLSHLGISLSYPSLIGSQRYRFNDEEVPGSQEKAAITPADEFADIDLSDLVWNSEDESSQEVDATSMSFKPASRPNDAHEVLSSSESSPSDGENEDTPFVAFNDKTPNSAVHGEDAGTQVGSKDGGSTNERGQYGATSGTLQRLSHACRQALRRSASTNLLADVYDNINPSNKIAQQVVGRKDAVESGTCATAFVLYDANAEDMRTDEYLDHFLKAGPLTEADVSLTSEEGQQLNELFQHAILRIIVTFGGERFTKFKDDVIASTPLQEHEIPPHVTEYFPMRTFHINESSITGNAEVVAEIFKEHGLDTDSEDFGKILKILAGDQLSIARLRALILNRAGHDSFSDSFLWAVFMPGLFHYKMNFVHGLMLTHYGKSNSARNPGCLNFHNTVLDRKPIALSSLPPFRTSRDLISVSLYARVLVCLEKVCGAKSLDEYAETATFEDLQQHAKQIVDQFANPEVVRKMRRQRTLERIAHEATHPISAPTTTELPTAAERPELDSEPIAQPPATMTQLPSVVQLPSTMQPLSGMQVPSTTPQLSAPQPSLATQPPRTQASTELESSQPQDTTPPRPPLTTSESATTSTPPFKPKTGDTVFENGCLFMRDALVLRELTDAVRVGNFKRIVLALKTMGAMYRGTGRLKYAYEILQLVHNLEHVWPKPLREIVLKNWLVNPTGKPGKFHEVDLLQEHLNFWIKVIYSAHGSSASWDWLAMISPCIGVLRKIAQQIHEDLGSRQGSKHTDPDLQRDIARLVASLKNHNVYGVEPGRIIEQEDAEVPNVVSAGFKNMKGPIDDYNRAFRRLQRRCRMSPLAGDPYVRARTVPGSTGELAAVADDSLRPVTIVADEEEDESTVDNPGEPTEGPWDDFNLVDRDEPEVVFSLDDERDVALEVDAMDF